MFAIFSCQRNLFLIQILKHRQEGSKKQTFTFFFSISREEQKFASFAPDSNLLGNS